ncbi:MAG: serine protease [Bacteriovoracia bacterium]
MGILLLLLLSPTVFAQPDCIDCDRRPALQEPVVSLGRTIAEKVDPGFCEEQIRMAARNDIEALQSAVKELNTTLKVYAEASPLLEAAYKKFENLPSSGNLNCGQVEDVRFAGDALRYRHTQAQKSIDFYVDYAKAVAEIKEPFSIKEITEKALCIQACVQKNGGSDSKLTAEHPCAVSCRAGADLLAETGSAAVSRVLLQPACLQPEYGTIKPGEALALAKRLKEEEKKSVQALMEAWQENQKAVERAQALTKKRSEAVEAALQKISGRVCTLEKILPALQEATSLARAPDTMYQGTGFHFSAQGKHFFASAQHVTGSGEDKYDEELHSLVIDYNPELHFFPRAVERFDFAADAVIKEIKSTKAPLRLVDAKKKPAPGQNFYLAGFPGIRGSKFSTFRCRFLGYGENVRGGSAYLLHCPADGFLDGLSGGPAVDEEGRVWGIVSNHAERADVVSVAPLAEGPGGKPVIGIQGTFLSDLCYGSIKELDPPHRCQIFPGSREQY